MDEYEAQKQYNSTTVAFFLYNRKLWFKHFTQAFWLQNDLCEFTALEQKFKMWFRTQKPGLNVCFDFWYTKIYPIKICYDKFNS